MQILCDTNLDTKSKTNAYQNINFLSPEIYIDFSQIDAKSYPKYETLYNKISQNYKILKEQFEIFNGDFSPIYALFNKLRPQTCIIYSPADLEYKNIAKRFGCKVQLVNRFDDINIDISENAFVIFANPSFPDGKFYQLENLLSLWENKNSTIVIDESFLSFTSEKSSSRFLAYMPNLYILKSTKMFYGNLGISISLLISSTINIKNIKEFEPKNKLSVFDISYLTAILEDKSFKRITKALNVKNNILLEKVLVNSSLFETVYPSRANFILAKLKNMTSFQLQEKLIKYKIFTNNCSKFDFLNDTFVQFVVTNEEDIEKLGNALSEIEKS